MEKHFENSLRNITRYGDTDIFPFPIENHVFFDKMDDTIKLLLDIHGDLKASLSSTPPANEGALAPVNYTGFRWANQIDPLWNAYMLGVVLSIADQIEASRIDTSRNCVFSYRVKYNSETHQIFDTDFNWRTFIEHSMKEAVQSKFVVTCDISEFYPRLNHHRLENALKQLNLGCDSTHRILSLLSNFSGTYSFGLPVGGPAARILSELVLNQIDRLLLSQGIKFCRFADDYHMFCESTEDAYKALVFLSDKLLRNQGLQLQKSKTRIMSGQEFISTSPLKVDDHDAPENAPVLDTTQKAQSLLKFSIRFDPYSPNAQEDYEELKEQLKKFDIISLLQSELSKSRIHISLSRRIVSAIKYMDSDKIDEAIKSIVTNHDLLYQIYSNVLVVTKKVYDEISDETRSYVISHVRDLIKSGSHVFCVDLNLIYAVRLISCHHSPENEDLLVRLYRTTESSLLRRDIILVMARWKVWYWLSDLRTRFRTLGSAERRAFVIASYQLKDEGNHWRQHMTRELTPLETLVRKWAAEKANTAGWSVPL